MIIWPLPLCENCHRPDRIFNLGAYFTDGGTFAQVWVCLNCEAIGVANHYQEGHHDRETRSGGPQD